MLDPQTIQSRNRAAAAQATADKRLPFIVEAEDLPWPGGRPFPFPYIGEFAPPGWRRVQTHFVDSSGFGDQTEPALTGEEFGERLQAGRGYAIVSMGQFQVHVGEFVPPGGK